MSCWLMTVDIHSIDATTDKNRGGILSHSQRSKTSSSEGHDPAGLNWQGPVVGKGKHLKDYLKGGLGIPHIDDSFLQRDTYGKWGCPEGIPVQVLDSWSFDQIRNDKRYREKWRAWAQPLVEKREFHHW